MSSPAPLLRPPIPGNRTGGGSRPPRLGLAIPPSPSARPLNTDSNLPALNTQTQRTGPPQLQLATPHGSSSVPYEQVGNGRPPPQPLGATSASVGSEGSHSRTSSFTMLEGRASVPTSAASQYSALSFAMSLRQPVQRQGSPDPQSAAGSMYSDRAGSEGGAPGMERDNSMNGLPDIDKLSLEKGRNLDVEDLDDDGWRVASSEKRIIELGSLGEGAGGAVTRCKLRGGNTVFALKIITTDPNPEVKKQIMRELHFNKDCASPYICRYYGAFIDHSSGTISIAMEFCEGGSLDSVYREVKRLGGRTGEKVLGKVAAGVLNGLTYLHGQKIIHRDIKPSNILLCRNGQVKLCDFGVSGEFGTKGDANTFIGTSYYMAPERITGQSYTITSDVWSLGVTLLEVAQHRFPFPADGTGEVQPRAGLIDLLTYIVRQSIPKLKDEPEQGIRWSENFKFFIDCWYGPFYSVLDARIFERGDRKLTTLVAISSLEKEQSRRATPWRMLEHPWMVEMSNKKVNMQIFLATVWEWKE